ncbi:attractin-like [Anguilla rostrata]|uniref:attractin-like n=1 Tax=Anguilla rostrata TaxID=7938 RepID=UPI0030CDD36F
MNAAAVFTVAVLFCVSCLCAAIGIAFSQHSNFMDLVQFFVTFFSCFLSLLLVAAVVWKIKQSCWASRRREQLLREMQQMASRPFATINVALEAEEEPPDLIGGNVKGVPKPIALEPCFGNKAAVLSIFVRLPRGSGGVPPPGQSGQLPASPPLFHLVAFSIHLSSLALLPQSPSPSPFHSVF